MYQVRLRCRACGLGITKTSSAPTLLEANDEIRLDAESDGWLDVTPWLSDFIVHDATGALHDAPGVCDNCAPFHTGFSQWL